MIPILVILSNLLLLPQCQTVPATGETRLTLISTAEEIRLGHEADAQIRATIGVYEDPSLQNYLGELGLKMAKVCERPQLPWSFQVPDDAAINAFAVPGGFIYVTRGILACCNSESELIGILGHEIGHVTASGWRQNAEVVRKSLLSFAELRDPAALAVQPLRLEVIGLRQSMTLRQYYEQRGCPIGLSELGLLNRLDPDAEILQGRLIKWVTAGRQ